MNVNGTLNLCILHCFEANSLGKHLKFIRSKIQIDCLFFFAGYDANKLTLSQNKLK